MANVEKPPAAAPERSQIASTKNASVDFPDALVDGQTLKSALSALQRGPIRFHRNNVIACEGDAADYIFLVVSGVVRSCRTFENGERNVVAFYLPGDLLGWDEQRCTLSVEAATNAVVLFIKRGALMSLAACDSRVASFLLAITTGELQRAHEHALLLKRNAKGRVTTFLSDWSKRTGETRQINLPMSHQDIADHLGLKLETLSRMITELEREGTLVRSSSCRKLIVRNHSALLHAAT